MWTCFTESVPIKRHPACAYVTNLSPSSVLPYLPLTADQLFWTGRSAFFHVIRQTTMTIKSWISEISATSSKRNWAYGKCGCRLITLNFAYILKSPVVRLLPNCWRPFYARTPTARATPAGKIKNESLIAGSSNLSATFKIYLHLLIYERPNWTISVQGSFP